MLLRCMYNVVLTLWNCCSHLCMPRQKQILHKRLWSILSCKIVIVPLPTKFFFTGKSVCRRFHLFNYKCAKEAAKMASQVSYCNSFFIIQIFIISLCVTYGKIYKHCIGCCSFYRILSTYESELAWIWSETYCSILLCMHVSHQHST